MLDLQVVITEFGKVDCAKCNEYRNLTGAFNYTITGNIGSGIYSQDDPFLLFFSQYFNFP
jgi:hypothetical protein